MLERTVKNDERVLVASLERYCDARGLELQALSHAWILRLAGGERSHLVFGYDLGLNPSASARIADDKCATWQVLGAGGVPCVEHRLFLHPDLFDYVDVGANWPRLIEAFEEFGRDVVVKDNQGTAGKAVFRARTLAELEQHTTRLFATCRSICLSPFLAIEEELRFVLLDRECPLAYTKQRDGRDWRHNLGHGARPELYDQSQPDWDDRLGLAQRALRALDLRFAAVDIVRAAGHDAVLEVNSGVMLEHACGWHPLGKALADRIYHRALDAR